MSDDFGSKAALNKAGFSNITKIADTLQGYLYKAVETETNKDIVIKVTRKSLHRDSIGIVNNRKYNISEDVLTEAYILKYLTQQRNIPESIVQYHDLLECNNNYYVVMENGGLDLFAFVVKAHRLIANGHISIYEWHRAVKCIFAQMLESIEYIHSKRICHYDISIENYLINDVQVQCTPNPDTTDSNIEFVCKDIQIKLIDFGLSKRFKKCDHNFQSNKFVGKSDYKSPEIVSKQSFDARKNDIWCLGIILFAMIIGRKPWTKASDSDDIFKEIMNGNIIEVIKKWNRMDYVNEELIDLFTSFFQFEQSRICLDEIKQHSWLN